MSRALVGHRIKSAFVAPDDIVLGGIPPEAVEAALVGRRVEAVGRKGKHFWLELDERPWVFGHLGMSGWIRELDAPSIRLQSHGDAPFDDSNGRPRFLKLLLESDEGRRIAFTDGRRLGRITLANSVEEAKPLQKLGFDAYDELPKLAVLVKLLAKRKAPIKAVLLDQTVFAGVGNWIADEVLYHAKIAPQRLANSLSEKEVAALRKAIVAVLKLAVEADADYEKYPETWLFHHRWGGSRGAERIGGREIVRETVGGRTSAWVPGVQR